MSDDLIHSGTLQRPERLTSVFTAVCTCGWSGHMNNKKRACQELEAHLADPDAPAIPPRTDPNRALADETQPAWMMSTHTIKTELLERLQQVRPVKAWSKGVTVKELCEFAVRELQDADQTPPTRRALELAHELRDHERR